MLQWAIHDIQRSLWRYTPFSKRTGECCTEHIIFPPGAKICHRGSISASISHIRSHYDSCEALIIFIGSFSTVSSGCQECMHLVNSLMSLAYQISSGSVTASMLTVGQQEGGKNCIGNWLCCLLRCIYILRTCYYDTTRR